MTPRYSVGFINTLIDLMGYGLSKVSISCHGHKAYLTLYFGRDETSYITVKGNITRVSQAHTASTFAVKYGITANIINKNTKIPEALGMIVKSRRILQAYFIGVPSVVSGFDRSYFITKKDLDSLVAG